MKNGVHKSTVLLTRGTICILNSFLSVLFHKLIVNHKVFKLKKESLKKITLKDKNHTRIVILTLQTGYL